jgi:glycerate kinase
VATRILIVPDKFKGTLNAGEAARAIARGWRRERPADRLELAPMSDGGDGFGEVLGLGMKAVARHTITTDAAGRRCRARWWWHAASRTAIIESARVIGLALLPPGRFHPFQLDTFGLGALLRDASALRATRCLVGIGGSATNDGGFGLARALGWEFLDRSGTSLRRWTELGRLARLHPPDSAIFFRSLTVAVDVRNPLLGTSGCTRVYGPQKGLRRADFAASERGLRRLARVVARQRGRDHASLAGAGAAGGLGFGFAAFLGAKLESGFELFAEQTDLARRMRDSDLVITGEGAIDRQTVMGKGVGRIAEWCRRWRIPCLALAGVVTPEAEKSACFDQAWALSRITSQEEALARPGYWLSRLAAEAARGLDLERKRGLKKRQSEAGHSVGLMLKSSREHQ